MYLQGTHHEHMQRGQKMQRNAIQCAFSAMMKSKEARGEKGLHCIVQCACLPGSWSGQKCLKVKFWPHLSHWGWRPTKQGAASPGIGGHRAACFSFSKIQRTLHYQGRDKRDKIAETLTNGMKIFPYS